MPNLTSDQRGINVMTGAVIIGVMIASIGVGAYLNKSFEEEYGVQAILLVPCILQCVALAVLFLNWPNPDVTLWCAFGIVGVILTYSGAFILCKKKAIDVGASESGMIKAIAAQFLMPIGVGLLVIVVVVVITLMTSKRKKHK